MVDRPWPGSSGPECLGLFLQQSQSDARERASDHNGDTKLWGEPGDNGSQDGDEKRDDQDQCITIAL